MAATNNTVLALQLPAGVSHALLATVIAKLPPSDPRSTPFLNGWATISTSNLVFPVRKHSSSTARSFQSIPQAIRQKVYEWVLAHRLPIEVTTFRIRNVTGKKKWHAIRRGTAPKMRNLPPKSYALTHIRDPQLTHDLLRTFYGRNRFLLDNVSDMNNFFLDLGSMRQYVQTMIVRSASGWTAGGYPRIMNSLYPAMELKYIRFHYLCAGSTLYQKGDRIHINTLFKYILPFLRRWHQVNDAPHGGRRVLDIVQFFDHHNTFTARAATAQSNFRRMVAWDLGLPFSCGLTRRITSPGAAAV